jgi:microcystin-dependent protein
VGGTQWDAKGLRLKNVGTATATTDAVTKVYVDNKVAQVSSGATQPPLKWQFTGLAGANGTYTVTGAEVNGDTAYEVSIDGLIQEPGVDFTVDPDTDTLTIVPNISAGADIVVIQRGFGVPVTGTVGTNSLVDGSVTADKISTTDTKFNVQSNGNVGIGTTSPGHPLTVEGTTQKIYAQIGDSTNNSFSSPQIVLRLNGDSLATGVGPGLAFNGGVECAQLFGVRASGGAGGDFYIKTRTYDAVTNTSSLVEYFRIKEDGKVGIGTASPAYALDVVGDVNITGNYKVNGTNLQTVPTGTVSAFAGSAAPAGYLLCDGTDVNRTTYAALAAVLEDPATPGTYIYGNGNGTTTFNLPDLRGRVVAGMGGSLLSGTDAVADTGGAKEHTLTVAEMPSHTHAGSTQSGLGAESGTARLSNDVGNLTGPTGGGQAHNNVQPTIILNYIIKI